MEFKYMVKGLVKQSFILRRAFFCAGRKIEFRINENEIEFVKAHCEIAELIDTTPKPVLKEEPKGVENGNQSKRIGQSKIKHKKNI